MALVVNDRVRETSTTTGTGSFTLAGAQTGFETFSSAIGNTNTTYYAISNQANGEFEVGLGTVGAGTLSRDTIISSSNSDAAVNFSAGTKDVFCTLPASKAVILDASGNIVANNGSNLTNLNADNLASGTLPDARFPATLPAVSGANLTSLNATNVASGTLSSDRLPTVPTSKGGTGLTTIGTANQVLAVNGAGTALEYQTPTTGDITGVTAGTGLSGGGTSGDVTLDLDLNELTTSTADADGDFFAVVDSIGAQKKLTKGNIAISGFNNDSGFIDGSSLNASNLSSGTVPDARFPATLPAISGANLTNLDASDLASGTIPDARFPATLPALNGSALTNLNASNLASGTVPIARIDLNLLTTSVTDGDGDFFVVVDSVGAEKKLTKGNINISGFNNDAGYTSNTGDITGVTAGTLLDGGGTSGTVTLNVDLSELATSVTDGDGDFFVVVDSVNAQRKLTKGNINISGFNNDSGFTTNTGTVTSVSGGNGLTGTVTTSGSLNVGAGTGIDVAADSISVDVSDFMTNGSNNRIVTATGTDAMNAETNLTFDGTTLDVSGVLKADKGYVPEATLTDGATISWNMSTQSVAKVTLGGNRTVAAPTNGSTGQFASLLVIQDATGSRTLTWNAVYEFASDTAPTLSTTGTKADLFVFRYNGTKWLEVGRNLLLTVS